MFYRNKRKYRNRDECWNDFFKEIVYEIYKNSKNLVRALISIFEGGDRQKPENFEKEIKKKNN